jgi:predicted DNA-binding antitoxin AbrB/MazE fold protein
MTQHVNAIYENGVLKPLKPLDLKDQELVSLSIDRRTEKGQELDHDDEYLPLFAEDGDPNVSWEAVQAVLAKLPDSLTEDFNRERDGRF